jgi:hypothetical protein
MRPFLDFHRYLAGLYVGRMSPREQQEDLAAQ